MAITRISQRRSFLSKLRETVSPIGNAVEVAHTELAARMDELRETDVEIREIADDSRDLIRWAKSNNRQRQYVDAGANVIAFHDRMKRVASLLGKYVNGLDIKDKRYFRESSDPGALDILDKYDANKVYASCRNFDQLVKEALGLSDIYYGARDKLDNVSDVASNVFTGKGRSGIGLDSRRNTGFYKLVKDSTQMIVDRSERMFKKMLSIFSALESGISRRKPDIYVANAKLFLREYEAFHAAFLSFYNAVVIPLREHKAEMDAGAAAEKASDRAAMRDAGEQAQLLNIEEQGSVPTTLPSAKVPSLAPMTDLSTPPSTPKSKNPSAPELDLSGFQNGSRSHQALNNIFDEQEAYMNKTPAKPVLQLLPEEDDSSIDELPPDTQRSPPPFRPGTARGRLPYTPAPLPSELAKHTDKDDGEDEEARKKKLKSLNKLQRTNIFKQAQQSNDSSFDDFKRRQEELEAEDDRAHHGSPALNDILDEADARLDAMNEEDIVAKDLARPLPEDPDYAPDTVPDMALDDSDINQSLNVIPDEIKFLPKHKRPQFHVGLPSDALKRSNDQFLHAMSKLASIGDEKTMVETILEHSEKIQEIDPAGAARLLSISAKMLEKKKI